MHVGPSRTPTFAAAAVVAAVLLVLPTAGCGGAQGPVDGARAHAHLERLVALGPRPFGSEALAKAADYITGELTRLGLSPQRQEVEHATEKKMIRNLWVQIDGEDPAQGPILILGAHYDTKLASGHQDAAHNFPFVGAIDGGGGPAVLLELARVLAQRPQRPKVNIWLYWIDAEESLDWTWNDERALLGSKAFCKWLSESKTLARVKAFVLLDLIGSKDWKIDRDGNSDGRLQDLFERAAKAMGESKRLYEFPKPQEIAELQRRGQKWGIVDDHATFSRYGVPSVLLIDFDRRIPGAAKDPRYEQWWHTADDDLPATDPRALAFAGNLVLQALPDLEAFVLGRK
ncbi:MAG: Zn-dependent exopeptidase M28 [Planctomycetes bacterium]|nr:Zn-dependent exopeptidase M28 [Planctomycetota bacterium]